MAAVERPERAVEWASPRPRAPASRLPAAKGRRPPAPSRAARPWCAAGDEGARREASRTECRAGLRAPGSGLPALAAPPRPASARASARPPARPPAGRAAAGLQGEGAGRGRDSRVCARGTGPGEARGGGSLPRGRHGAPGHLQPAAHSRISASGPRSPRSSGESKAGGRGRQVAREAVAATWPRPKRRRWNPPARREAERSRTGSGAALRRALRRGPALART